MRIASSVDTRTIKFYRPSGISKNTRGIFTAFKAFQSEDSAIKRNFYPYFGVTINS